MGSGIDVSNKEYRVITDFLYKNAGKFATCKK